MNTPNHGSSSDDVKTFFRSALVAAKDNDTDTHSLADAQQHKADHTVDKRMQQKLKTFAPKIAEMMKKIAAMDTEDYNFHIRKRSFTDIRRHTYLTASLDANRLVSTRVPAVPWLKTHFVFIPTMDEDTLFEGKRDEYDRRACEYDSAFGANVACMGTIAYAMSAYGIRVVPTTPALEANMRQNIREESFVNVLGMRQTEYRRLFQPLASGAQTTILTAKSTRARMAVKKEHQKLQGIVKGNLATLWKVIDGSRQGDVIDNVDCQAVCRALGGKPASNDLLNDLRSSFGEIRCTWKKRQSTGSYKGMLDSRHNKAALQFFLEMVHGEISPITRKPLIEQKPNHLTCNYKRAIMYTHSAADGFERFFVHPLNQDGLLIRFIVVNTPRAVGMNIKPADVIHKPEVPDNIGTDIQSSARAMRVCPFHPDNLSECIDDQRGGKHWRCMPETQYVARYSYLYPNENRVRALVRQQKILQTVRNALAISALDCADHEKVHKGTIMTRNCMHKQLVLTEDPLKQMTNLFNPSVQQFVTLIRNIQVKKQLQELVAMDFWRRQDLFQVVISALQNSDPQVMPLLLGLSRPSGAPLLYFRLSPSTTDSDKLALLLHKELKRFLNRTADTRTYIAFEIFRGILNSYHEALTKTSTNNANQGNNNQTPLANETTSEPIRNRSKNTYTPTNSVALVARIFMFVGMTDPRIAQDSNFVSRADVIMSGTPKLAAIRQHLSTSLKRPPTWNQISKNLYQSADENERKLFLLGLNFAEALNAAGLSPPDLDNVFDYALAVYYSSDRVFEKALRKLITVEAIQNLQQLATVVYNQTTIRTPANNRITATSNQKGMTRKKPMPIQLGQITARNNMTNISRLSSSFRTVIRRFMRFADAQKVRQPLQASGAQFQKLLEKYKVTLSSNAEKKRAESVLLYARAAQQNNRLTDTTDNMTAMQISPQQRPGKRPRPSASNSPPGRAFRRRSQ